MVFLPMETTLKTELVPAKALDMFAADDFFYDGEAPKALLAVVGDLGGSSGSTGRWRM